MSFKVDTKLEKCPSLVDSGLIRFILSIWLIDVSIGQVEYNERFYWRDVLIDFLFIWCILCVRSLYCLLTVTIDNQPNQVVHFPFGITCDDSFFLCKAVTLCSTELLRIRKGSSKANVQLFFFFDL